MSNEISQNPQALAQQVLHAANSLSDDEAAQRYQQILAQLPPDQAEDLNALALSQVQTGDRRNLASQFRQAHQNPDSPFDGYDYADDDEAASPLGLGRMSARAQQQDPALFGGMLGGNSPLGGQIGKAALAALAALLIRRTMSGQMQGQGRAGGGGDPISAILGGLLGGGAGGLAGQPGAEGGSPLGSILGGLLGGGGGGFGGQPAPQRNQPAPGGDLGSILGGLLGGGAANQHMPRGGGDLGSILGSILGGGGGESGHRKR